MNKEVLRRIRLAGKRIMLWGSLGALAFCILEVVVVNLPRWLYQVNGFANSSIAPVELLLLLAIPLMCGGVLLVLAWILEGSTT